MPPEIFLPSKSCKNAKKAENAKKAKKANLLQGAHAQSATTKVYSTTMGLGKKWWAAVVPPGGLQSAAHRRWCEACWITTRSPSATAPDQSQMANLKGQALYARLRFLSPSLFSLPRRLGTTGARH